MAKTTFTTSDGLTKKLWEEELFRDALVQSYFHRFMGDSKESLVYTKEELTKDYGDRITFGLRMRLTGAGVTSGTTLEGQEEALTTYSYNLSLEQYRHAVRDAGAIDRQRAAFSIDSESEAAIKDWGAEKIDDLCFSAIVNSPTRIAYLTDATTFTTTTSLATAKAGLAATSQLTANFLSFVKTYAKTGANRAFVPLRPIKIEGREYYILLIHPDAMYDLKTDTTFQQFLRDAEVRGPTNPLFTGASAIVDGVIVHEHEKMPITTDGDGSSLPCAQGVLLGAQALCWAWGKRPEIVMRDFDYGNERGYAWGMIAGTGKPQFNSEDYGSLGIEVARTQVSDA